MISLETYEQILASKGVSLGKLGLQDVALRRADALRVIQLLRDSLVPILGGDVYLERTGGIDVGYANWHVDRQNGEDPDEFVTRSCIRAERYVAEFPQRVDEKPLFVLVVASA